jgi:hypothetical protein
LISAVFVSEVVTAEVATLEVPVSEIPAAVCGASATAAAAAFVDQMSAADSNALARAQVEAAFCSTEFFPVLPSRATNRSRLSQSLTIE